ncbi:hypothetical protein [Streptococcus infantis]|uniref:hypothetical protein n=1 Tax=Streptococcus infantis TaxID=68892 RepID=UPI0039C46DEC
MKPYKINLFRLGLLLPSYLIFNVVYSITYDSGGFAFIILWPAFFASYAGIVLGNIFIFRDISKLKASFEDNELIQKTCTIQLVLATIGFFMQIIGFKGAPLNYIDNYPLLVSASIVYSIVLLIGIYQTIKLGQGKDISAKLGFVFAVTVILFTNLILLTTSFSPSSPANTYSTPNFAEEFQSLGLKGTVQVVSKGREIEAYYGTHVKLKYTEKLSDGTYLEEDLRADIKEHNGEHISEFYPPLETKIEALLNDKEKELFNTVKPKEFDFLFDVHKKRPLLEKEENKIKKDVANQINILFDHRVTFDYSYQFKPVSNEKYIATIISQAVINREKGDFDAAGFYNLTTKDFMKKQAVFLDIDCIFASLDPNASSYNSREHVDFFKEKLLALPKNSFNDGIYEIRGNYWGDGKTIYVTCVFVVEDGVGHFEEDEIVENQTN